jgi:hypothetical protein
VEVCVSLAEYFRRLVARDLGRPETATDVDRIFDLGRSTDDLKLPAAEEFENRLLGPTIISPLISVLYAAFSTVTSGPNLGTTGTTEGFSVENVKPNPTFTATSFLYSTSSRSFEYPSVTVSSAGQTLLSRNRVQLAFGSSLVQRSAGANQTKGGPMRSDRRISTWLAFYLPVSKEKRH